MEEWAVDGCSRQESHLGRARLGGGCLSARPRELGGRGGWTEPRRSHVGFGPPPRHTALARSCTGFSCLRGRHIAGNASRARMETSGVAPEIRPCRGRVILFHHVPMSLKVRRGVAPRTPGLQPGAVLSGPRTTFGWRRTRTSPPTRGAHALAGRPGTLVRFTIQKPSPGVAPGPPPYHGGALLLSYEGLTPPLGFAPRPSRLTAGRSTVELERIAVARIALAASASRTQRSTKLSYTT